MEYLKGLLYGLAFAESVSKDKISHLCNPIRITFEDKSNLSFAINRGIAHTYGNFTAMLTNEESHNLFDIHEWWITNEQKSKIQSLGYEFDGEIRVNFKEFVQIIEILGVIDAELTKENWLEIYLNKYHND